MSQRRTRMEIIYDILIAIQAKGGKIKPTHLMYKSNLSHELMKSYLEELSEKGFIDKEEKENTMVLITIKGLQFLEQYRKMKEFTDSFGL
tara:strand:- start:11231 stop:11500 length:270 start_codon:yes stop_codon:yes gene_type:complete